ncbi:hypothetical protein Tco_1395818 [Tanacetum coccineum]
MRGAKPNSFYDPKLKRGLGYENPYTLKKAISVNPKLYDPSYLHNSNIRANVCDTEEMIEDATKSQLKMKGKLEDPIAIEKKVNFVMVNYGKLNYLYETFVPQVELSLEQKYFLEASTSTNAKDVQVMINVFESMESDLDETLKQNELLNDRLLEATLTHDVEKYVLMYSESKDDNVNVEIEKVKSESKDVQENLLKRIKILENNL